MNHGGWDAKVTKKLRTAVFISVYWTPLNTANHFASPKSLPRMAVLSGVHCTIKIRVKFITSSLVNLAIVRHAVRYSDNNNADEKQTGF